MQETHVMPETHVMQETHVMPEMQGVQQEHHLDENVNLWSDSMSMSSIDELDASNEPIIYADQDLNIDHDNLNYQDAGADIHMQTLQTSLVAWSNVFANTPGHENMKMYSSVLDMAASALSSSIAAGVQESTSVAAGGAASSSRAAGGAASSYAGILNPEAVANAANKSRKKRKTGQAGQASASKKK